MFFTSRSIRPSGRLGRAASAMLATVALAAGSTLSVSTAAAAESIAVSPGCRMVSTTVPGAVLGDSAVDALDGAAGTLLSTPQPPLTINGRLCVPPREPRTVVLALHGLTANNEYWDAQLQPETYSFARRAMREGYAVLAIDRLGYGSSSHPLSAAVTLDVQARIVHEVIGQLRAGKIGGVTFPHVALLGHSYGSAVSWLEASRWNDADAVIATGWGSTIQTLPLAKFFSSFYPAGLDPKFAGKILDPGYLTTLPGSRKNLLYDSGNIDPRMIDYDETVLRDTAAAGEGLTFYNRFGAIPVTSLPASNEEVQLPLSDHTRNIKVPTFLVNGKSEIFFCGTESKDCSSAEALYTSQQQFFTAQACLQTAVIGDAGHALNLQRNATQTYDVVINWLNRSLGTSGQHRDMYRAACARG